MFKSQPLAYCVAMLFVLLASFGGPVAAQESGSLATRGQFYINNPIGTIAWVPQANSRHQATQLRRLRVLGGAHCYQLPQTQTYWFIMNHRNVARAGEASFASVRIEYETGSDENFVHFYRNGGWFQNGRRIPRFFERNSNSLGLSASQFVEMHSRPAGGFPSDRLSRVQEMTEGLHAEVVRNGFNSWDQAHLLGRPSLEANDIDRLSVRLLRFQAMARNSSNRPVLFQLRRGRAIGARMVIDVPRFRSSESRIIHRLRFAPARC